MSKPDSKKSRSVSIYDYADYREFLRDWVRFVPLTRRGQLARIAEAGNVHKTTLSQILSGKKDLSLEQAYAISNYLGLVPDEADFFVLLVNLARAATVALRESFKRQIESRKKARQQLSHRVTRNRELTDRERATFYSSWIYSAVRNLSAIQGCGQPAEISKRLGVELAILNPIIEFLLENGLCVRTPNGIAPGPKMTHIEASSPFVSRHHANWRVKALGIHHVLRPENELAYTAPMTLSAEDVSQVRNLLADLVERTDRLVGPSKSEKLYCMCIDWFEVR